jgi:hypothetical protein
MKAYFDRDLGRDLRSDFRWNGGLRHIVLRHLAIN